MVKKNNTKICLYCRYFKNSPAYLEETYHGFTALSSAYSSIRKDDGICSENNEYLSAYDWCDSFSRAE